MSTICEIRNKYSSKIDSLDLDLILAHHLKKSREFTLIHDDSTISSQKRRVIESSIRRRKRGEPLAYILGYKEFYGLNFFVSKNTLIPRPETEIMIEKVLNLIIKNKLFKNSVILDIGTGSGNIITSLAHQLKDADFDFYATDVSEKALLVAKKNARQNKLNKKIKFIKSNLLSNKKLFEKINNQKNIIITANLPYLENNWKKKLDKPETQGLKFEPNIALYGGTDGLDLYRNLSKQIKKIETKNIFIFCEIENFQRKNMKEIFSFAKKIEFTKDLADKWRVVVIKI